MSKLKLAILVVTGLMILNNCAITTHQKTKNEYHPINPPKSRFVSTLNIPSDRISPFVSINVGTQELYQKVRTDFYKKDYRMSIGLICASFAGVSIFAGIKWWDAKWISGEEPDTTYYVRWLSIAGALAGAYGVYEVLKINSSTSHMRNLSDIVSEERILKHDTRYMGLHPLREEILTVNSLFGNERKKIYTDQKGYVKVDIRDFYGSCPIDSSLRLKITFNNLSKQITIPRDYIKSVKDYEKEAKKVFNQAQVAQKKGRYSDALRKYDLITEKYPESEPASEAKTRIEVIKIALVRNQIQKVSAEKVRNAILNLGLSTSGGNALANAIGNLSSNDAVSIIKDGLGMPLTDSKASQEYRNLTIYQKFYAITCYKNYMGKGTVDRLSDMLNIPTSTAEKLYHINPKNLCEK